MTIPIPGSEPMEVSAHFDLGVDRLASTSEMEHIEDPWTPSDSALPEPVEPHELHTPAEDLRPWADGLELPGI